MDKRPNNEKFKKFHLRHYPHCNNCNIKVTKSTCTLDHEIRIAEGGADVLDNTQLLCLTCDALKTNAEQMTDKQDNLRKQLNEVEACITQQLSVFKANTRKTKTERSKYNKYIKEIQNYKP